MSIPGAPTAKEKKYDRQLRLWAANGQEALENSHILLINATAAGTETLKNLVLPGIGRFTILDDSVVSEEDLGVNFFLDETALGQSRAKKTTELLQELNPDVKGEYITDSIEKFIASDTSKLSSFTVVIATGDIKSSTLLDLDKILWPLNIPFFIVKSIGFTVTIRLVLSEHTIIESHPDSTVDLRLFQPFKELQDLVTEKTGNIDSKELTTNHEHGHVPYVLILLKYLEDWKSTHDGKPPSNYKEKNEFKSFIRSKMWSSDEENFEEAISAVLPHFNPSVIPSSTKLIFEDEKCKNLTTDSTNFWIVANAIAEFSREKNDGLLPLPGALPDMKAESKDYIGLQNVFKSKARSDLKEVYDIVKRLLVELKKDSNSITEAEVETFCKHAGYAKLIRGRSLKDEYESNLKGKVVAQNIDESTSLIHYYLAIRAYESHISDPSNPKQLPPGFTDSSVESDSEKLDSHAKSLLSKLSVEPSEESFEYVAKAIREVVRVGGGELHNIGSLTGGIVAQEVIKVVTRQYIPMNNTVVFDGITSRSEVFEL